MSRVQMHLVYANDTRHSYNLAIYPLVQKNAITLERLEMNMKALKGEEMTGTDAEACAYLFTAALTNPVDHDWGQIYLYIATQTYRR
jgi:hypothetical protein